MCTINIVRRCLVSSGMAGLSLFIASEANAQCAGASPTDGVPDSAAIQACLDSGTEVRLEPGHPGYIIDAKIRFRSDDRLLTSTGPSKAKLVAHAWLAEPMLEVQDANDYEISELIFDGNKGSRGRYDLCNDDFRPEGNNLLVSGNGFVIHHLDVINAMCGTGMQVTGSNFQIYSIYFAWNGYSSKPGASQPWADGLTLTRCDGGYVHSNNFVDNTDVDLMAGNGIGCVVQANTITHVGAYGFAGIHVGQEGSRAGSTLAYNSVNANYNTLAFGIIVGPHPWRDFEWTPDVGVVRDNSSNGAVVNVAVDGIQAGAVYSNAATNAQGNDGWGGCTLAADYTAGDFGSAYVAPGYIWRTYHGGGCQ